MSEPWFRCYIGPDIRYDTGRWLAIFQFFPARDLMTRAEEGRLVLCALCVTVMTTSRFPFFEVSRYSDANEITYRRAGDFSGATR